MRNFVFATAFLVLVLGCGSAWAAGPVTATYNWTGFYGGLNAGLAVNDSSYTATPTGLFSTIPPADISALTDSGKFNNTAATIGGQVGYNYQCGRFVYGLETDFNYNSSNTSSTGFNGIAMIGFPFTVSQQVDYFGTLRARLGFTPADRYLIYVTGGLAYGYVSSSSYIPLSGAIFSGSSSGMQAGWAVGAGNEYALTNNWSVKLEYLYIDLGSTSYSYSGPGVPPGYTYTTNIDTAQHVIRVGFNYKF
ncbi:MAG: outer membrane protein [Syntrophobacteraceae bacterium]